MLRRATAEVEALRAERARLRGGRTLDFGNREGPLERGTPPPRVGDKRAADGTSAAKSQQITPQAGGTAALPLAELRPVPARDGAPTADIAAIESAMACPGKLHVAMAEAMGQPAMVASLSAAGSPAAVELV
eukprot:2624741-Pleurochrysis_carterae.AAC.1